MSESIPGPVREPLRKRDGVPASPRSAKHPMAFTGWELVRGALIAVAVFEPLSAVVLVILATTRRSDDRSGLGSMMRTLVLYLPTATMFTLIAMFILGLPLAWSLGTALRRLRPFWVHLVAFALLGALVAAVVELVALRFPLDSSGTAIDWGLVTWLYLTPAGIGTAFGWWCTATLALRRDRAGS